MWGGAPGWARSARVGGGTCLSQVWGVALECVFLYNENDIKFLQARCHMQVSTRQRGWVGGCVAGEAAVLFQQGSVGPPDFRHPLEALHTNTNCPVEILHMNANCCPSLPTNPAGDTNPKAQALQQRYGGGYEWRADDSSGTFFPGRHATVYCKGQRVGANDAARTLRLGCPSQVAGERWLLWPLCT